MTHVMCNPWKRTFTFAPLVLLTMFSPRGVLGNMENLCKAHAKTSQLKIKLSLPIFYSQIIGRKIKTCDYYSQLFFKH